MVEICQMYHWDYYTYLNQPLWFIEMITEKMIIDGKKQQAEQHKK